MPEPFIGEMRIFAGNYAPQGWMLCEGQQLSIAEYPVLHTVLGTTYGGDGQTTFALPDLRGRVPVGTGSASGQIVLQLGQTYGTETWTLTPDQLPRHSHRFSASSALATSHSPQYCSFAATAANVLLYPDSTKPTVAPRAFNPAMIASSTGPAEPHENMMPTTAIHYIIAVAGLSPIP